MSKFRRKGINEENLWRNFEDISLQRQIENFIVKLNRILIKIIIKFKSHIISLLLVCYAHRYVYISCIF